MKLSVINYKLLVKKRSSGQSLIETIIAIFVLVTGLSAGLSLAIFAFGSTSDIAEKIVATGLAREAVEAVRRMRDSNWLWGRSNGELANCPELGAGQLCYRNWLTAPYDFHGSRAGTNYRMVFTPSAAGNKWTLDTGSNYQLNYDPSAGLSHAVSGSAANYYRKIYIIHQNTDDPAAETQVLVRSVVWWHGKGCAAITNFTAPSDTNCKIITEEYLENWKNY